MNALHRSVCLISFFLRIFSCVSFASFNAVKSHSESIHRASTKDNQTVLQCILEEQGLEQTTQYVHDRMALFEECLVPKSFYFVRHGQTDWNREGRLQGQQDIPLNDIGRSQAYALQPIVNQLDVTHVYFSPLVRARETMEIACANLDVFKFPLDAIKQRNYGHLEGSALSQQVVDTAGNLFNVEDGETYAAFYERVIKCVNSVLHAIDGKVLFVAHGGVFRILCKAAHRSCDVISNCNIFYFVAPNETCDEWCIYEL